MTTATQQSSLVSDADMFAAEPTKDFETREVTVRADGGLRFDGLRVGDVLVSGDAPGAEVGFVSVGTRYVSVLASEGGPLVTRFPKDENVIVERRFETAASRAVSDRWEMQRTLLTAINEAPGRLARAQAAVDTSVGDSRSLAGRLGTVLSEHARTTLLLAVATSWNRSREADYTGPPRADVLAVAEQHAAHYRKKILDSARSTGLNGSTSFMANVADSVELAAMANFVGAADEDVFASW